MLKGFVAACMAFVVAGLPLVSSAQEQLTATFGTTNGSGPIPGGTVTIELKPDGTIAATATVLGTQNLWGVAFDSALLYESYNFSFPYASTTAWHGSYGSFYAGWAVEYSHLLESTTQSWLIGAPGTFTSLSQLLNGNRSDFDVFMFSVDPQSFVTSEYVANFSTLAPIPEPETYVLLVAGLSAAALSRRRRSQAEIC